MYVNVYGLLERLWTLVHGTGHPAGPLTAGAHSDRDTRVRQHYTQQQAAGRARARTPTVPRESGCAPHPGAGGGARATRGSFTLRFIRYFDWYRVQSTNTALYHITSTRGCDLCRVLYSVLCRVLYTCVPYGVYTRN